MEHLPAAGRAAEAADPANFTGDATLTRFLSDDAGAQGRVYRVTFRAGARTHWHTHTDVQILCVLEGRCEVQAWGGAVVVAGPGDVVRIDAAEKHWHGAAYDGPMTHLAINLGRRTVWMEPVER